MRTRYPILFAFIVSVALWMQSCDQKPVKADKNIQYVSGADEVTYLKLGKEIVDTVGATLRSNLMKAMKDSGPSAAVRFCNTEAIGLTGTYSMKYSTEVRRVSDRNRNVANSPDAMEAEVIAYYRRMLEKGEPLSPKVAIDENGRKNFYAPIITGAACLTCHGAADAMQPGLVNIIDSLYPNDRAKGYGADELRGIWSIRFKSS